MMSALNLLPHSDKMLLIDEVVEFKEDFIHTKTRITGDNAFLKEGLFATYQGVEIMAQSLGCLKSLLCKDKEAKLGFLLGVRNFEILAPFIELGALLHAKSKLSLQDESGFGVYECELFCERNGALELVAKANLSVLSPSEEVLQEIMQKR